MKRNTLMSSTRWISSLVVILCGWSCLRAANPADELLRLVPEDVGFCVVIQDLREHGERLAASPFVKQLRVAYLNKSPEWAQMQGLNEFFQKQFEVDLTRVRDDILGDAVVFAYRPGPPGKPHEEQGLILVQARNAELLATLVRKFNEAELSEGKLKEVKEAEFKGEKYFRRIKPEGEDLYAIRGGTFVLATRDQMLQEVLTRLGQQAKAPTPLQTALQTGAPGKPLASVWINPRAFDAELQHNLKSAKGGDATALANFIRYWDAIDSVVLSLALDADVYVNATVQARVAALPASARRFLETASEASDLPAKLPADALLACAGRLQCDALFEMLSEFLTPEDAKSLREKADGFMRAAGGRKFIDDVLPCLGPDFAICMTAPPAEDKNWFPHVFLALGVSPGKNKDKPVDEAVLEAINWTATAAVFAYNGLGGSPLTVETMIVDKLKIKYVDGGDGFPPGLRPAFTLQQGFLTIGSSPEALRKAGEVLKAKPAVRDHQPIFWMSVKDLRKFLNDRREQVTEYLAQKDKINKTDAAKRIENLLELVKWIDRVELTRPQAGQVSLRVQLTAALK
jgi:hypothetical protein